MKTITIKNLTMQVIKIILQAISIPVIAAAIVAGVVALLIWFIFSALIKAISDGHLSKEEKKEVWMEEYWRAKCEKNKKVFINSCGKLVQMDDHEAHIGGN